MTQYSATQEKLYSLYCDYVTQNNIHVKSRYASLAGIRVLSEQEFEAIWNELPASSQAIWREKFEMGYERGPRHTAS